MPSTVVWIVDGRAFVGDSTPLHALASRLGAGERARMQHFLRPQRAREFLLGRLLMRHALQQATGCAFDAIVVTERAGAAPLVHIAGHPADGLTQPAVSLSHSRGWIACAIACHCQIGVDIEVPSPKRDLQALAELAFTPRENDWLATQARPEQAFYQLWCGKEALYKYCSNAGLQTDGLLSSGPVLQLGHPHHLHHQYTADYHLCLCSPVAPSRHQRQELALSTLLSSSRTCITPSITSNQKGGNHVHITSLAARGWRTAAHHRLLDAGRAHGQAADQAAATGTEGTATGTAQ